MVTPTPFAVNPEEAIAYLRDKLRVPTAAWTDIWQEMHARAFVVAGARSEALLADFQNAVLRAIAEGRTLAQFRADFDGIVAAHGWSYHGTSGWRSAVIFNTNLRMAYAAGRWQRIQKVKATRPWLRYIAVMDERTRPLHREWHNTVLPVDNPFWKTHFPPNGWNCRCSVQSLSDRDLKRLGLKVSDAPPPSALIPKVVSGGGGKATVMVPEGIDPGFAYNPGEAAFGGASIIKSETHGSWRPLASPLPPAAPLPPLPVDTPVAVPLDYEPQTEQLIREAVAAAIGGLESVITDPVGARIAIGEALVSHFMGDAIRQTGRIRYLPLLPELITDPAEIWIGWAAGPDGKVSLRRRYVKLVDLGGGRILGLVCDADGRLWSGTTFFSGRKSPALKLRDGVMIYRRG